MTRWVEVTFLPSERIAAVPAGSTLFAAAHWADLAVESVCGGRGSCGRCRIRIADEPAEASAADRTHLSQAELAEGWRLACTSRLAANCVCTIPEIHGVPSIAITGAAPPVRLEPTLRRISLELEEPPPEDHLGEVERLRHALRTAGLAPRIDDASARSLERTLHQTGRRVTAVICDDRLLTIESPDPDRPLLGLSFDLGTTTVAGGLLDLATGEVLAQAAALNRQSVFGADVISRIAHADRSPAAAGELQRAALRTLSDLATDLCRSAGVRSENVYQALVVGNTVMLHLLLGIDARPLAVAPFVPAFRGPKDTSAAELGLPLHPRARLETLPVIGAYVGADTVAGLHATGLLTGRGVRLFIDVGTNSEIALALPGRVLATSAPAGPAFEGSGIRCGTMAVGGAIESVRLGGDGNLDLGVIGGGEPRGLCGSGLIDALALLTRARLLDRTGRLVDDRTAAAHSLGRRLTEIDGVRAFRLADGVFLTQRDIRELQSAKSAIATGVEVLLETAGLAPENLDETLLAGSFGSAIDPVSAIAIGLVPRVPAESVRFVGNVAAEGAKMALVSFRERQMARELPERVEYVELSAREDFNDRFLSGLGFPEPES